MQGYNNKVKPILSVQHALELLEVFISSDRKDEFGVTELSKKLSLHKNNVFRLLATLSSHGYIEQNDTTENYSLGIGIFTLGQKFVNKLGFIKVAKPFMERIVNEVNESAYIGMLRSGSVVYLDMVESFNPVRIVSRVGKDVPAYCTSIGKVQLAHSTIEEIEQLYKTNKLKRFTDNTITSITDLKKELYDVLDKGYAIDDEEFEKDVYCIAAPIKDYKGSAVAAISVAGPKVRFTEERVQNEIIPILLKYSREVSKRLGYINL